MQALIDAVQAYAQAHYNEGGWDMVVECYDRAEIAELLTERGVTTPEQAIAVVGKLVAVIREVEEDRALAGY